MLLLDILPKTLSVWLFFLSLLSRLSPTLSIYINYASFKLVCLFADGWQKCDKKGRFSFWSFRMAETTFVDKKIQNIPAIDNKLHYSEKQIKLDKSSI